MRTAVHNPFVPGGDRAPEVWAGRAGDQSARARKFFPCNVSACCSWPTTPGTTRVVGALLARSLCCRRLQEPHVERMEGTAERRAAQRRRISIDGVEPRCPPAAAPRSRSSTSAMRALRARRTRGSPGARRGRTAAGSVTPKSASRRVVRGCTGNRTGAGSAARSGGRCRATAAGRHRRRGPGRGWPAACRSWCCRPGGPRPRARLRQRGPPAPG